MDIDYITNLLLNMSGGLLPQHLSVKEQRLLQAEFGYHWFEHLGYLDGGTIWCGKWSHEVVKPNPSLPF